MLSELTIVIPARNAADTIARAVSSAVAQRPGRIVLVDHASTDDTVNLARRAGGDRLDVVTAPADSTLGCARQLGLAAVESEFGMWLDADDELLPGRAERLLARLQDDESDLAYDEIDLHDGATGAFVKRLPIPHLLGEGRGIVRLFERNYVPGPGVPAFRTAPAQAIGFDPALHGAEDYDFLLRSIVAAHRISLVRQAGYRQFSYPTTLSRHSEQQADGVRRALRKHRAEQVEELLWRAGFSPRTTGWAMIGFLAQRGDYQEALLWLDRVPSGSRRDFHAGTLLAAIGRHADAEIPLRRALDDAAAPELLNNFGVVMAALNRPEEAADMFTDALFHFPEYRDAFANLHGGSPSRLTLLPLRSDPSRNDYG